MKIRDIDGATIAEPENYADCIELIRSDYYRVYGKRIGSPLKLWLTHFRNQGVGFLFYYRLCEHRGLLYPYLRLRLEKYIRKYGLQIPLKAKTGFGLYIGHACGLVVNGSAVIGSNVNLSHFTTVGSIKGHAATLADGAYIGPSVCIVENVRVGRNSMTGAGAVVTKNVPDRATVAGVPARTINTDNSYEPANSWIIKR